jgi:hypothetical protein
MAYCLPEPKVPRKVEASALLSPFDSLIWERSRTERLFDFAIGWRSIRRRTSGLRLLRAAVPAQRTDCRAG